MRTLRLGAHGEDVESWQFFLRGVGLYFDEVNGTFGAATEAATEAFQRRHALVEDGIAGNRTLGEAMRLGFSVAEDGAASPGSLEWPPPPRFAPLGHAGREAAFGRFTFEPAPVPGNPEAITITSGWAAENLEVVTVPQLAHVPGAPQHGRIQLHRLVAPRVVELFSRWEQADLLPLVLSFGGAFVARFIRGSRKTLSAHAHGSAFDINVAWNGFGAVPALLGSKGSLRKLVPIANELGFYWGGHFTKRDGMHFELVRF